MNYRPISSCVAALLLGLALNSCGKKAPEPGTIKDEALMVGLDFYLDTCHQDLVARDLGTLGVQAIDSPVERWSLGGGHEIATLEAPRYELFRAFGGRRSQRQLRAMTWTGDVEAVATMLTSYPPPVHDLIETAPTG